MNSVTLTGLDLLQRHAVIFNEVKNIFEGNDHENATLLTLL